jgi:hypothetical protein
MKTNGFSKILNKKQHKVYHTIKQTINTSPNLKLTLSSMFKQIYVRIKDKSLNERIRKKERKNLIVGPTPQAISCKMVRYPKQKQKQNKLTNVQLQGRIEKSSS